MQNLVNRGGLVTYRGFRNDKGEPVDAVLPQDSKVSMTRMEIVDTRDAINASLRAHCRFPLSNRNTALF